MMNLHGVDVFIVNPDTPSLPEEHGKFTLRMISNRGTRVWPGPSPTTDLIDWPQCRYLSEEVVTDEEIDELIGHLGKLGHQWSKCQKLFKKDGVNLFSEAY